MKYMVCIVSIIICLFIGNRLANLDKPMAMWLPINEDELQFDFESENRYDHPTCTGPTIYIWGKKHDTYNDYIWASFEGGDSNNIIIGFPDGHIEVIEISKLIQAGSLEAYIWISSCEDTGEIILGGSEGNYSEEFNFNFENTEEILK